MSDVATENETHEDPLVALIDNEIARRESMARGGEPAEPEQSPAAAAVESLEAANRMLEGVVQLDEQAAQERDRLAADFAAAQADSDAEERELAGGQVLEDALERLEWDDDTSAWHGADHVASQAPDRLGEYLQQWYASDPQAVIRWRGMHREIVEARDSRLYGLEQELAEAEEGQRATEAARQELQERQHAAVAAYKELDALIARDPAAKRFKDKIGAISQQALPADGLRGEAEGRAHVARSYEIAAAEDLARKRASFQIPFLEIEWRERQFAGEDLDPFDEAAAFEAETARQLAKLVPTLRKPGALADHRMYEAETNGLDPSHSLDRGLAAMDERMAESERISGMFEAMHRDAEKSRAEAEKIPRSRRRTM